MKKMEQNLAILTLEAALFPRKLASHCLIFDFCVPFCFGSGSKSGSGSAKAKSCDSCSSGFGYGSTTLVLSSN
jgi:hypothetical protein